MSAMSGEPPPPLKVAVVLLAAGLSSRMGARNKLLIGIEGEALVRRTARTYLAAGADVYAVVGHEAAAVRAALADLPLSFVENPRFAEGQQTSVRAGLDSLPEGYDAVLVALADQAALEPADISDLLRAFAEGDRDRILVPFHNGQRGNPVLFPAGIIAEIRASGRNAACRKFIDANPHLTRPHEAASDHFTIDIDTPEDLRNFIDRLPQPSIIAGRPSPG
jgi:molybdenum cofactor cytidylyltransferase